MQFKPQNPPDTATTSLICLMTEVSFKYTYTVFENQSKSPI